MLRSQDILEFMDRYLKYGRLFLKMHLVGMFNKEKALFLSFFLQSKKTVLQINNFLQQIIGHT